MKYQLVLVSKNLTNILIMYKQGEKNENNNTLWESKIPKGNDESCRKNGVKG